LRQFGIDSNAPPEQQTIYCFHNSAAGCQKRRTASVSVSTRFYDYTDLDGTATTFEHELGRVESDAATVLVALSREPTPRLLEQHRHELAFFLALLLTRWDYLSNAIGRPIHGRHVAAEGRLLKS
jgi:hypothetical protein